MCEKIESVNPSTGRINMMDSMSQLSIDLFFHLLSLIDLSDVISLCSVNRKFHTYGITYNQRWFILTKQKYGDLYAFPDVYSEISSKLKVNYVLYSKLVTWLDPVAQCKLNYQNEKYSLMTNFLARYIWGGNLYEILKEEKDHDILDDMYLFLKAQKYPQPNKLPEPHHLRSACYIMAAHGSMDGLIKIQELGGDLGDFINSALHRAANLGHLDVVKYLLDNGADINSEFGTALDWAVLNNQRTMCKYLISRGATITEELKRNPRWEELRKLLNL